MRPRSAAVIGAGWAGCAAAARLADAGVEVTLYEAAAELGGRARRLQLELGGVSHTLDNGQHLLIGAYTATATLLRQFGVELDTVLQRRPFELWYPDGFHLRAICAPAPWHLVAALLSARGMPWSDRIALARLLRRLTAAAWSVGADRDAASWLRSEGQSPRLITRVWRPLAIAALNTPLADASAQIFANVLRDSLGANSTASMLWLPRVDLSALLPDAAERFVLARGGRSRRNARVQWVEPAERGYRVLAAGDVEPVHADTVVYAAAPSYLPQIAGSVPGLQDTLALIAGFEHQPICTAYLKYAPEVALPRGFAALLDDAGRGDYGQWVFDRGALDPVNRGVLSVVVSARGPHEQLALSALCEALAGQLSRQLGVPAPLAARAVVEKRATLAARPGLTRPLPATACPDFALAGDWTASDYPSTLEGAVRSGIAAAAHVLA